MADKLEIYGGVFGDGTKSQAEMACQELQYWYRGLISPPHQGIGRAFDPPSVSQMSDEPQLLPTLVKAEPFPVVKTDKIDFLQGVYPSEKTYTVSLWQKLWRKIA